MTDRQPNLELYTTEGTVPPEKLYATRRADAELLSLCTKGDYAYILTSRQMGKSSLIVRTTRKLRELGISAAHVDLQGITEENLSAERFYLGLIDALEDELGIHTGYMTWWQNNEQIGLVQRLVKYFQLVLLPHQKSKTVIFLDEIENTLRFPYRDAFFGAIRHLFNERANDPTLKDLSFVIIGSAKPGDLINDPNLTPFNIGRRLELTDFTFDEASTLTAGMGLPEAEAGQVLQWIYKWTNGHPYLTQKLIVEVIERSQSNWTEADVDAIVRETFLGRGTTQDDNLAHTGRMLTEKRFAPNFPSELRLYNKIWKGRSRVKDEDTSQDKNHLKLAGVVRKKEGELIVSNLIYQAAFNKPWFQEHNPSELMKRIAYALVWLVVGSIITSIIILALSNKKLNSKNRELEAALKENKSLAESEKQLRQQLEVALSDANTKKREAESQREVAEEQSSEASNQRQIAEEQERLAQEQKRLADEQRKRAEKLQQIAEDERRKAQARKQLAEAMQLTIQGDRSASDNDFTTAQFLYGSAITLNDSQELRSKYAEMQSKPKFKALWTANAISESRSIAASTNVGLVAIGKDDNSIELIDSHSGKVVSSLKGHNTYVNILSFNQSGTQLASLDGEGFINVWDTKSFTLLKRIFLGRLEKDQFVIDEKQLAIRMVFNSDGSSITFLNREGDIIEINLQTNKFTTLKKGASNFGDISYGLDSQLAYTGIYGSIGLIKQGNEKNISTPQTGFNRLLFIPNGKLLSAGGQTIYLWDIDSGKQIGHITGNFNSIEDVTVSPDASTLAIADGKGRLRVWNLDDKTEVASLSGFSSLIAQVVFISNTKVLTLALDGKVVCWELIPGDQNRLVLRAHSKGIIDMAFSPNGNLLATCSMDRSVKVWDLDKALAILTFKSGENSYTARVAFSPDGRWLFRGGIDENVHLVNVFTGQEDILMTNQKDAIVNGAFSPNGKTLAVVTDNNRVLLWDLTNRSLTHTYQVNGEFIYKTAFSSNGLALALADVNGAVTLLNISNGVQKTATDHSGFVMDVVFTKDGERVISGGMDWTLRFWDASDLKPVRYVTALNEPISSLTISPDGQRLAWSTGARRRIRIMDLDAERELPSITGLPSSTLAIAYSPDGKWLAAGDMTGEVHFWNKDYLEKIAQASPSQLVQNFGISTNLYAAPSLMFNEKLLSPEEMRGALGDEKMSLSLVTEPFSQSSKQINEAKRPLLDIIPPVSVMAQTALFNICANAPAKAQLNTFPLTFKSPAQLCSNYPPLELRRADGDYPRSREDWQNGVDAKAGDEIFALVYISNTAANDPITPESIARNIRLTANVENKGSEHKVSITFGGDNTNKVSQSLPVKIGNDEYLEIVPDSGEAYDYQASTLLKKGLKIGNGNVIFIENLYPGFETDLFIRFKIKVKRRSQ